MEHIEWQAGLVAAMARKAEERAVEMALVTGTDGVAAVLDGLACTFYVTPLVPFGNVYSFRSAEAWEAWRNEAEGD